MPISVPRILQRLKDGKSKQECDYVEFDSIMENETEIDIRQERLKSIWRNECHESSNQDITQHIQSLEYKPSIQKIDSKHLQTSHSHGARSMPSIMHEHIVNTKNQFNKVFASAFVSENIVTFGTKDNKLMLLDVQKGKICQIRLPNPEKSFDYNRKLDNNNNDKNKSNKNDLNSNPCGIHDLKFNKTNNLLITGGHEPEDVSLFRYDDNVHYIGPRKFSHNLIPLATLKFHKDWVFAMDFIDDQHIVVGGKDGQLSIWDVSTMEQTYEQYREKHGLKLHNKTNHHNDESESNKHGIRNQHDILGLNESGLNQGLLGNELNENNKTNEHDNMLLYNSDGTMLDQDHVAQLRSKQQTTTASQDRCNVPILRKPNHFTSNTHHRIRALKSFSQSPLSHSQCVVTLATTGEVQIYDISQCKILLKEVLPYEKETVCVEINQDKGQIVVGAQGHIQLFDPRCGMQQSLKVIDSLDKNWGCRTVSCFTDLLTIGGGLGRLSFYDLRNEKYLDCQPNQSNHGSSQHKPMHFRTMDAGWIKQDDVFQNIFALHSLPTPTAIYTHCYNPLRSKLFAAGGPTPYGLYGSAASVYY